MLKNVYIAGGVRTPHGTYLGSLADVPAAKLGARRIRVIDIDGVAVRNCRENVFINDVTKVVEVREGSIEQAEGDPPYDFLVANIIRSTIISLYEKIDAAVKPGGVVVLSGLLQSDYKQWRLSSTG